MNKQICILCGNTLNDFLEFRKKKYYQCLSCSSVLLSPADYISLEDEVARYNSHNNDVNDPGYQSFVLPIYNAVMKDFGTDKSGLDFGCGPGPVITKLLSDSGYEVSLYDPYFANNPAVLKDKYNFIICSEVAEHFKNPALEFERLKCLLKPSGKLYCMTSLYRNDINFREWYYKNDSTHVFFYTRNTFEWIKNAFGYLSLEIHNNLVILGN